MSFGRYSFGKVSFGGAVGVKIDVAPETYDFGSLGAGATAETGLDYFTLVNNSYFAVDVYIKGTDMTGGIPWTLADDGNPGSDIVALKAGLEGGSYNIIMKKSEPFNTLVEALAGEQKWGLKIYAPTEFSDGIEKSGTVTLTAVAS